MEGTLQVRKVITGLSLEANSLYCQQLVLLDPAHQISRSFVGRCYFSNPVVKKALFGLSSYKAKGGPVQALSSSSVSLQYNTALVVPPLLRPSSDRIFLSISGLAVSKKPRNCFREQVETSSGV